MKTKFNKIYTILYGVCIMFGVLSCQNEPLNSDQKDSSQDSTELARKSKVATFVWPECDSQPSSQVELFAGQTILVGNVNIEVVGANYEITYNITNDGYCLAETHLSVVTAKENFPLNNGGNPVIGAFEYSETHDCITSYTYTVPTSKGNYIAAHAVVNCVTDVTSEAFESSLPDQVDVTVTSKGGPNSYFTIDIAAGNMLSGNNQEAWCADQDTFLNNGESFTGDVYSSYETLPADKFENPENFGGVNWLMNQNFIGMEASLALGNYTFGDIQVAIWTLIEDTLLSPPAFANPYNMDRVNMLVAMALENNDFVPSCGDEVVIVIVPNDNKQSVFITIPAPCGECSETAFGDGCEFPGNNWFTWFEYGGAS